MSVSGQEIVCSECGGEGVVHVQQNGDDAEFPCKACEPVRSVEQNTSTTLFRVRVLTGGHYHYTDIAAADIHAATTAVMRKYPSVIEAQGWGRSPARREGWGLDMSVTRVEASVSDPVVEIQIMQCEQCMRYALGANNTRVTTHHCVSFRPVANVYIDSTGAEDLRRALEAI